MELWKLNTCPKCKGALFVGSDTYGHYLTCANCGWNRDLNSGSPLPKVNDNEADREGIEDGCNIAPSCFQCPLPDCWWETPTARRAYLWDLSALALFEQYKYLGTAKAVAVVAEDLKVGARTVYRALKRNATHLGDSNG
jgi:DNA-directed RNA polymerase subunit M/transcription elongation factor TFIIS